MTIYSNLPPLNPFNSETPNHEVFPKLTHATNKVQEAARHQLGELQSEIHSLKDKVDSVLTMRQVELGQDNCQTLQMLSTFLSQVSTEGIDTIRQQQHLTEITRTVNQFLSLVHYLNQEIEGLTAECTTHQMSNWNELNQTMTQLTDSTNIGSVLKRKLEPFNSVIKNRIMNWSKRAKVSLLNAAINNPEKQIPEKHLVAILKNFHELEKKLKSDPETASLMLKFIKNHFIPLEEFHVVPTASETANPSSFIKFDETSPTVMLYKPSAGTASFTQYVPQGDEWRRQIASYLLDKENGGKLAVPMSLLGTFGEGEDQKIGSVQIFEKSLGEVTALSTQDRHHLSADDLHLLTIHRGRLYELDGHLGNLLWKLDDGGNIRLIPIDFDYILPDFLAAVDLRKIPSPKIGWEFFPQMDQPFSDKSKEYIQNIDLNKETCTLNSLELSPGSILLARATTLAFKEAAQRNMTPGQIHDFISSETFRYNFFESGKDTVKNLSSAEGPLLDEDLQFLQTFDADFMSVLDTTLNDFISNTKEDNQKIEELTKALKGPNLKEASNNATYYVRRFVDEGNFRGAVKLLNEMIVGTEGVDPQSLNEAITSIQQASRGKYQQQVFNAIRSAIDAYEKVGNQEQAQQLEKWLKEDFS